MRAQLSVIVTCRDAQACLAQSAQALFEGVQAGLLRELILADGGSRDDTPLIAEELGAALVTAPGGRGAWMAAAAQVARGEWLMFLPVDSLPAPGWTGAVLARMQAGGPAVLASAASGLKGLAQRLRPAEPARGLLLTARDYRRAGGFADCPLPERALVRALDQRPAVLMGSLSPRVPGTVF